MAVAREVEGAIVTHIWEALISWSIDLVAQILKGTVTVANHHAPQVLTPLAAWHVAREIQPLAVGTHSRVVVGRQSVGCNLKLCRPSPPCFAAAGFINLHTGSRVGFS